MATIVARQLAISTAKLLLRGASGTSRRDYSTIASAAAEVVAGLTGLELDIASVTIEGVNRQEWAQYNIDSYTTLLDHLAPSGRPTSVGVAELNAVALGVLLGTFASKVLGQYEPAFVSAQPRVWMVDENIDNFAEQADLNANEVALWVLVHELTHRAQFYGVPWFRSRIVELMTQLFAASTMSPIDLVGEVFARLRGLGAGQSLDISTLLLPERLRAVAQEATSMMTVAEGHAEWVMRQVPKELIPHRDAFETAIDARRQTGGIAKVIAQVSGLTAKRSQYSRGLHFFEVLAEVDAEAPRRVFAEPRGLPTADELAEPKRWLMRMGFTPVQALRA
ncbi:MAG: zinc-dependent metalloprotease [Ferrimicrobium sp.]|jgi:coenzyme F420 biosynthesis associated uncharacterized protein|uniref:Zinc-dependent metalloprotease n=1 Tax=Ferrimicrobium acidiphilum TaxID=121039 RepID=A0ABV3Y332_9ACTN|nr:zinc-dependent metalloprotease [Ferrimicrobium acidiphilum]